MKMSKVAKMIGVDRRTIYNWVTHKSLEKFFSEDARNEGDRQLSEHDIFIANTINHLRRSITTDWNEIAEQLESGYIITDLSVGAAEVDTGKTPLQQFTRTLAIAQERDLAIKQLEVVQEKLQGIEELHKAEISEVRQQYEEKLNEEQQVRIKEIERLMREASERESKLSRELGKLEAKLELLQDEDK